MYMNRHTLTQMHTDKHTPTQTAPPSLSLADSGKPWCGACTDHTREHRMPQHVAEATTLVPSLVLEIKSVSIPLSGLVNLIVEV